MKHGTNRAYCAGGCRCDKCRAAHNEVARKYGTNIREGKRGERKRRWDREHQKVCRCGNRMDRRASRCTDCDTAERHAQRHQRRLRIVQLWLQGSTLREIAAALDSTPNAVAREVHDMRYDGFDLPRRNPGYAEAVSR